jgi:hypothetical protein
MGGAAEDMTVTWEKREIDIVSAVLEKDLTKV